MKGNMPKGYEWGVQGAERRCKKGRAIGRMIMGIKKEFLERGTRIESVREGFLVWRIVGVYTREGLEEVIQELERWTEVEEGLKTIIGGDFNAQTGKEGGGIGWKREVGGKEEGRNSKDRKINNEGSRIFGKERVEDI